MYYLFSVLRETDSAIVNQLSCYLCVTTFFTNCAAFRNTFSYHIKCIVFGHSLNATIIHRGIKSNCENPRNIIYNCCSYTKVAASVCD